MTHILTILHLNLLDIYASTASRFHSFLILHDRLNKFESMTTGRPTRKKFRIQWCSKAIVVLIRTEKSQVSETNIARHEMRIISITDQSDEYIIDNIQLGDVYFHASALESSLYIRMITNFVSSSRNSYIFNHDDPLTHFHSLFNSVVLNRLWRLWTIYFFDIRSNIIFFVADIVIVLIESRISIMCFAFIWLRIWWWLEYSFRFFDILFRNNYHRITNLSKI